MALEDVNPEKEYYWYYNLYWYEKFDDLTVTEDTNDFGQGKTNTIKTIEKWNKGEYGAQDKNDLWGIIQRKTVNDSEEVTTDTTKINYYSKGWFVPSKAEWAAFGDMLTTKKGFISDYGHGNSNYAIYGLQEGYFSSVNSSNGYYAHGASYTTNYIHRVAFA